MPKHEKLDIADKIQLSISYTIKFSLVIALLISAISFRWKLVFFTALILFLTFTPSIIKKNYKITLPIELDLSITIFIYASLFLGEIESYYLKFSWWDIFLHGISATILGFIGFLIVYSLYSEKKLKTSPIFVALFSFCFAVSVGAVWEIYEFGMDQTFGMNMQKSGLVDTMWDLIFDSIGALIVSAAGFFYIRGVGHPLFDRLVNKFVEKNPKIFREKRK
jgi:hypothetical protein